MQMKERKWEESNEVNESSIEVFDVMASMDDDIEEFKIDKAGRNRNVTELRRRIEERLDGKRIDHQFDYDFDEISETVQ